MPKWMRKLSADMLMLRDEFLRERGTEGGTAAQFREFVLSRNEKEPLRFKVRHNELLCSAADAAWDKQAKVTELPLFNGKVLVDLITRPALKEDGSYNFDDERSYQKVHYTAATVLDLIQFAEIKERKAAQAVDAARETRAMANEAIRRAKGDLETRLVDIADSASGLKRAAGE